MEPAADTLAAAGPVDVDIASLEPGQQVTVMWRGTPIFIVNRTESALQALQNPQERAALRDPDSREMQQPGYARNWHRSIEPRILVLVGVCTHLGCIPHYRPDSGSADLGPAWPGGSFCPCHGSKYDMAGRVFRGVPAPYNLPVPAYHFVNAQTLRIGENPPGKTFSFDSIEQL
jgi:ubiquinol-cytochrome c reductase iron-sulfur subunit